MANKGYTVGMLITGDASGAQKALKLTEEQLEALNKKVKAQGDVWDGFSAKQLKAMGGVAASIAKAGAVAVAAGAGIAAALVKSSIDSADATGILAGKLGVTTEALSKLEYAAKLSDVSQASLETGLKRLTKTLTDAADPASNAAKALASIGLSQKELINIPADEQLAKIADALNTVENQSQRAAIAQKIFGKGAIDMLPLLAEGSAGIKALGDEAERFGVVISGDMAAKAMAFNDNLDRIRTMATGLGLSLAERLMPAMGDLQQRILDLSNNREAMDGIATALKLLGEAAVTTAEGFVFLASALHDALTWDLEELNAEVLKTVQYLDYLEGIEKKGGTVDPNEKKRWQERLAFLQSERKAIHESALAQQFANVQSGSSTKLAEKETGAKRGVKEINDALGKSSEELAKQQAREREATEKALQAFWSKDAALKMTERDQARLTAQIQLGTAATQAERIAVDAAVQARYDEAKAIDARKAAWDRQVDKLVPKGSEASAKIDPWAEAMTGAIERVDSAFADAWRNAGDGFDGLLSSMADALQQWAAEMAHMAITRPLLEGLTAGLTGGASGAGGAAGSSAFGGGGIGSLKFLAGGLNGMGTSLMNGTLAAGRFFGPNAVGQSFLNYAGRTQAFGNQLGAPFGISGGGGYALGMGANLVGGIAGSYLGKSLYGGRESSGAGAAIGGVVGSLAIPIPVLGTFIGSAVGEVVDRALSGSDFSGKRVKLGVGTGSMVDGGGDWENVRTLDSGLRVGNLTRRVDEAGMSDEDAQAYLNAFDTLDSALTAMARAAGVAVDFSGKALPGMEQSYDGGTSGGAFFGSLAKGELRSLMEDAPAEFARQWVEALGEELPVRVREIMGDTAAATAEELMGAFGGALELDRLLNIDVLKDAASAAEDATKTITDAYGFATDAVVTLAQEYDGTTGSLLELTGALADQKAVAAALAAQYTELAAAVDATFADAITGIKESLMSEDELYAARRQQIADLTAALSTETDPQRLAELVAQIDSLARSAWGMLSPEEQKAMGGEYIAFLEDARKRAQDQIEAGTKLLAERERALVNAVDLEVVKASIDQQSAAANTLAAAATDFGAWVRALPGNITVTIPPINVTVASPSEVNV